MIKKIGLEHIEEIAHQLAVATMSWDEPLLIDKPYLQRYLLQA